MAGCESETWSNIGNSLFMIRHEGAEPEYFPWGVGEVRWKKGCEHGISFNRGTMGIYCFAGDAGFREWVDTFPEGCTLEIVEHPVGQRRDMHELGKVRMRMTGCVLRGRSIGNVVPLYRDGVEAIMLNTVAHGHLEVFW